MTISTELRKAGPFTGNGVTTAFPFSFKVFAATDATVTVANTQGNESVLALGADYAVALNADQDAAPGGTVTLAAPLSTGYRLVVSSAVPNLQPTDITNNGGFYPRVIEDALDRHVAQVQQIDEKVGRALKVAITSPLGDQALPSPVAGMLIGWNESSDGLKNYAPIGGTLLGQQLAAANGSSLVGFQQAGTGAVVRTAQDKMREWVSVKDFGAVGDGVADDTAAIQAATSASKSVFFPPGTYQISGSSVGWDSVNDVCMFGAGWESKIVRFDAGSVVEIQNATRVVVRDLYVQGVKTYNAAAGGISLLNCVNFSVTGNYVTASSRQGINIEACSEGLVSNNHVTNSWQDGIMVRSGSRRVTVTGNVVWENGEPTFAPPVGEGIHIYAAQEIAVVCNTVKGNKDNGITLEGADYTTVTGNIIYGQVVSGVSVNAATGYSGAGAVITGNVIKDNGAFGVILTRVSDGILSDNVIAENGAEGISIGISSNSADVQERWSVSGNRITNNTNYGVLVNWYSSKNRISGNIIDQPAGNALTVVRAQCGSNIVQDNTITAGAITDSGTETRIYNNDLGQKLSGRVTLVAGASTIAFSTNMPNSQYVVALEGSVNETLYTFNKLVSGFEIRSSNAASTAQVRWRIVDQKAI